ncbi:HPr(Ser) kinase/phosphatase [Candidatus Riflebacteria bacterium]
MLTVSELVNELELEVINGQEGKGLQNSISDQKFRIPGLELVGYYKFFPYGQILVMGSQEVSYLIQLPEEELKSNLTQLFQQKFPCVVIASPIEPPPLLNSLASEYECPLIWSKEDINEFAYRLTNYLHLKFVPKKVTHGVLVEVYGVGILILGPSATGKSECALELIKRGHRLISDDSVELVRVSDNTLIGLSNPIIGHHMEIRGLGIIDISQLFGVAATATEKRIDLITNFERWDEKKEYDRLGVVETTEEILLVKIPAKTIPVQAGRNLAILVETAAMDFNLKKIGVHSAKNFSRLLRSHIQYQKRDAILKK